MLVKCAVTAIGSIPDNVAQILQHWHSSSEEAGIRTRCSGNNAPAAGRRTVVHCSSGHGPGTRREEAPLIRFARMTQPRKNRMMPTHSQPSPFQASLSAASPSISNSRSPQPLSEPLLDVRYVSVCGPRPQQALI